MDIGMFEVNSEFGNSSLWSILSMTEYIIKLVLDDGSKQLVAQSHRSNIGIIGKPRQARLEISPGFEHLVDIILVTYIFVEKLRKDRERNGERS
jgi:hypothetical protein